MPVVPSLEVEKYLDFKDMTAYLRDVGKAAPHLVRVFSIGKSREGRPLLVAEVTNRNLKKGREKPGLWIDGGHQGWHLLGSMACLELLRFLVSGHGRDEFLTDLVDHHVFYIAPRLAPDEMEVCLTSGAITPQTPERDGPMVAAPPKQFRAESPLGSWTPYKRDNRLLVRRQPEDRKGPFYDLYRHLDSGRLAAMTPRDFPTKHPLEAADGPLQLASTRAVFEFLRSYQNIFGVISTSGPGDNLQMVVGEREEPWYRALGHRLGELSGLPCQASTPGAREGGQFLSWAVETLGILGIDCRMWSLRTAAGLKEDPKADPLWAEETEMMQLVRFCEKEFPGGFSEWTAVDEPDLGAGERGGWDWSKTWLNPPPGPYLARELKRFSRLALGLASAGPRLVIAEVSERMLGWSGGAGGANEPLRHLSVRVENRGYLPTCPLGRPQSTGAILSTQCTKGEAELLIGSSKAPVEDLQGTGFSQLPDGLPYGAGLPGAFATQRFVERDFLFRGNADIEIAVSHPMAGTDKVVSRPTQIMKPPSFPATGVVAVEAAAAEPIDVFEDAFPSFEDLYNESDSILEPPSKPTASSPRASVEAPPVQPAVSTETLGIGDEFGIPLPPMPSTPRAPGTPKAAGSEGPPRKVEFASLGDSNPPVSGSKGPFPQAKPAKGRVFGTPPQKPGLPTGPASGKAAQEESFDEGDFSPLPLVKSSSSAFEPLAPKSVPAPPPAPVDDLFDTGEEMAAYDTIGGRPPAARPTPPPPPSQEQPAAPPARLARVSAPQLLRRQRGTGGAGPTDPFNR